MVTASDLLTPEALARLRTVTNTLADQAQARFRDAVVPIYGAKKNGRPVHLGSAILLNINDTKLLLTAAHIVDENEFTTLYVGGGSELGLIEGRFSTTEALLGRDRDHYDFAFHAVSEELVAKLKGRFVGNSEIATSIPPGNGRLYTALGFPNSKHRKYNPVNNSVKSRLFPYSSIHKIDTDVASKLPSGGAHHIFMTYDKRSRDEEGLVVNSISPRGMSGGAVIDAGRPADLDVFFQKVLPTPLLSGVVIELKRKRVLLAVRMSVILPALLQQFPSNQKHMQASHYTETMK